MFRARRYIGAPSGFQQFVEEQFSILERESAQASELLRLAPTVRAPDRPRDGDVRYFTEYDPGSGAGFYGRHGGAWVKLG